MTQQQYMDLNNAQIVKDTKLIAYFKQIGDQAKLAIVTERVSMTKQDLTEE